MLIIGVYIFQCFSITLSSCIKKCSHLLKRIKKCSNLLTSFIHKKGKKIVQNIVVEYKNNLSLLIIIN